MNQLPFALQLGLLNPPITCPFDGSITLGMYFAGGTMSLVM
jgi:hypothetical protein